MDDAVKTQAASNGGGRPSLAVSLAIYLASTALVAYVLLFVFRGQFIPLSFGLPLLLCLWHKDVRLLWLMAATFIGMAAYNTFWVLPVISPSEYDRPVRWLMHVTNIVVIASVVHAVIKMTGRLRAQNARLEFANAAVQEKEEQYRDLFDSMNEGFCIVEVIFDQRERPVDYRFLKVNAAFERQTGLHDAEGRLMRELAPAHEAHWFEIYGRIALTGEPARFTDEARALNRWYDVSAYRVGRPKDRHVAIIFNDISGHMRAESELIESREHYRSLFENMPNGYAYCQMTYEGGVPADFIYLEVNPAFETLTGLRDAAGKRVSEVIPGIRQSSPALIETYGRVAATGKAERFEVYLDALGIWLDITVYSPKKEHFVAIFDNVTERKLAEEALRESEQRLRYHVENTPLAVVEWDAGFIVTRWAGEAENIFGWSAAETVGRPIMDLHMILEDDLPIVRNTMEKLTDGVSRHVVSTNRNYTKDRRVIHCTWYNTVMPDAAGKMKSVMSQVLDITERKKTEEAMLRMSGDLALRNVELEAMNREMESFIYSVSHDLRAPLRTISGFIKILTQDCAAQLDPQARGHMARIYGASEKMSRLIEGLLYLSHISRQEVSRIGLDMGKRASAIIEGLRAAEPGRRVEASIQDGMLVSADPGLADILLANLLGNAWKFTSKTEGATIEFGAEIKDGKTVYYVRDNGAGFDQEYAGKLFRPFQRLHSADEFEGTGIGLSIVERIIRSHGGKIWAEGEPGKGATFFFTLD